MARLVEGGGLGGVPEDGGGAGEEEEEFNVDDIDMELEMALDKKGSQVRFRKENVLKLFIFSISFDFRF